MLSLRESLIGKQQGKNSQAKACANIPVESNATSERSDGFRKRFDNMAVNSNVKDGPSREKNKPGRRIRRDGSHGINDGVANANKTKVLIVGLFVVRHVILDGNHESILL
jgi:hypothetical protein